MDLYKFGYERAKELHSAIEHEPKTVDHTDINGKTITRELTPEEESQFEDDFMQELEADHADDNDE
jgi:hypothetical protein